MKYTQCVSKAKEVISMSDHLTQKQFAEKLWDQYGKDHLIIVNSFTGRIIISDLPKMSQQQYDQLWWITFEQTEHGYRCGTDVVVECDRQQFVVTNSIYTPSWETFLRERYMVFTWERFRMTMLNMYCESDFEN